MKSTAAESARATVNTWLGGLPRCLQQSAANQQFVPRLSIWHSNFGLRKNEHVFLSPLQPTFAVAASTATASTAAAAAAAVTAAAVTAAPPPLAVSTAAPAAIPACVGSVMTTTIDDVNKHRARLYALYEFCGINKRLPDVHESHQGVAVGHWAEQYRQSYQQNSLDPDLATALQSIPGWDWSPRVTALSDSFQQSLQDLVAYAQRYGRPPQRITSRTSCIPHATDSISSCSSEKAAGKPSKGRATRQVPGDGERNNAFMISKQLLMQRKRGVLTQQQIDHAAQVVPGWRWDARIRSPPLDIIIERLQGFHEEHGRLPKADERLRDGFLIGEWCMARRGEYSRGHLEVDVAAAIEAQVPGWLWNRLDDAFERNVEALLGFVTAHGRTPSQREAWDGMRVGAWCNKRRLQYKAGTLAADRVAALEAVPGWWWSCDDMEPGC